MHLILDTCTLRPWRATDADSLARHADDRSVWLGLRDAFPHPYTLEDARRFLAQVAAQRPTTFFALEVEGEAAGGIGLSLGADVERLSAELGYWLARRHWGRGIATAAVLAFSRDRMRHHGLERIFALPYARNAASRRVLEKAGFQLEGCLRNAVVKDGVLQDQMVYALLRERARDGATPVAGDRGPRRR